MAEGAGLENRYTGNGIEGSNPSLSVPPMPALDRQLLPGEQVVHRARPHGIMFLAPVLLGLVGLVLAGLLQYAAGDYWYVGAGVAGLALLGAVGPALRYLSSEFIVTDKRVLARLGILNRRSLETLLGKIEAIGVEQNVTGRLLGYGTITITGTGGTQDRLERIADPLEFRRQVQGQIVELESRRGMPAPLLDRPTRVERECPFCAEPILARARVCKHCGRDVEPV